MGLFGDKGELEELRANFEELQQENESLREQIRVYERDRDNFRELKIVADRLTSENKALLAKMETFNVEKNAEKERISQGVDSLKVTIAAKEREIAELTSQITSKKDEIASKMFAITSKTTDIAISDGLSLSGGVKTERNISLGSDVTIKGDIEAGDTVTLGPRNIIIGVIRAKNVVSREACDFRGDIFATDKIILGDKAIVNKGLDCNGLIRFGNYIEMRYDFHTQGDIQTGSNCVFMRLHAEGEVILGPGTKAKHIVAGGNIELLDNVIIEEGVEYGGSMKLGRDVRIEGIIKARG